MRKIMTLAAIVFSTSAYSQGLSQYGMSDYYRPFAPEIYQIVPDFYFEDDWMPKIERAPKQSLPKYSGNVKVEIVAEQPDIVYFPNKERPGTIIVDTLDRKLYYILDNSDAFVYPIGVGRNGFTWTGVQTITRVQQWPDWTPPKEMLQRRPDLPAHMEGGIKNPLGAVAMYLGNTVYRIHGTNDPKSIGRADSSGCIRMINEHAVHLASLVEPGVTVVKVY